MTTTTGLPPHDIAAEQTVLGALMEGTELTRVRQSLPDPDAFFRPAHQTIYAAICYLADHGAPTDPITVKDALERSGQLVRCGGAPYLFELYQAASHNPAWHAAIITRHHQHRTLLAAFERARQALDHAAEPDQFNDALDQARTALDHATPATGPAGADLPDPILALYQPLDWKEVFAANPEGADWLIEPFIERGRSVAIYSPPKAGKSLLTLEFAAAVATGQPVLGNPSTDPASVLYVDIENSSADIGERLTSLGYGPADLDNLHYYSFPNLPALDSATGGQHLIALAKHHQPDLVVIDTVSRVIEGSENDADTFAQLYRHALAPLKGLGIAVIRLDHSGKNLEKGQRGSSAKNADVDAVWLLVKQTETAFYLRREMTRTNHGVPLIELRRHADPLRHEMVAAGSGLPPKIAQLIEYMDELDVPTDAGRDVVRIELAEAGVRASNNDISHAIRIRKERGW
ncbi:AAA family ATPase [Actinomadura scrupuli]|uniref:AAA family ATPase n=1 Tax=Actinomadura scrupuli TaxID=559629 RepID=UPI003D98F8B9